MTHDIKWDKIFQWGYIDNHCCIAAFASDYLWQNDHNNNTSPDSYGPRTQVMDWFRNQNLPEPERDWFRNSAKASSTTIKC